MQTYSADMLVDHHARQEEEMAFLCMESQTRGATGPFEIATLLKSPSVYEYGDEDLGDMKWGKAEKKRGRRKDQRVKQGGKKEEEIQSLWGGLLPGPYPLAGFMHWI